ncbi:unnamed protein product [Staurois parvus]|uniref:Uncharacterized protein n=1 Tax=Staurois parvus TaxID=386267 RepID=A0ABN9EBM2_9NEOB|nr:unnamed protein product [Staurois parvus]
MSARSCDQLCPITADHMGYLHRSSDHCVAPAAPPVSVHQCQLCAHPCHLPVPISAASVPDFSAHQCHINATYQCLSVSPISAANQCHLSVPVSAAYQCASVPPISACQCCLSVPT